MKYERPVLKVFLADEATGMDCGNGTNANPNCGFGTGVDETCYSGGTPGGGSGTCSDGTSAGNCGSGSGAWSFCPAGLGYGGFACGYGEGADGTCSSGPSATDCNYGYNR